MRKLLLASVFTAFAASLAMAAPAPVASSNVSIGGVQGTYSSTTIKGNGAAVGGAVSGNYATVTTGAQASPSGTSTTGTQTQVGGTITGGYSTGNAKTSSTGVQGTIVSGSAAAIAVPVSTKKH
jgi:hypothetical protein